MTLAILRYLSPFSMQFEARTTQHLTPIIYIR